KNEPSILQTVIKRPFKSYFMMGGFTFGLTLISNFVTSFIDSTRRDLLLSYPDAYTMGVLTKSTYFLFLWPSFYIKLFSSPREVLYFGSSLENYANDQLMITTS